MILTQARTVYFHYQTLSAIRFNQFVPTGDKPDEESNKSTIILICATVLVSVVIISITVIAIVLVFAKNRRRDAMEKVERERNELYGTYNLGPEYNVATDRNQRYNEDGGNTHAVVTDHNPYYEM